MPGIQKWTMEEILHILLLKRSGDTSIDIMNEHNKRFPTHVLNSLSGVNYVWTRFREDPL
jgi:hypothetical protein